MNEYARLAQVKPIDARNTAELMAACFGFDEERAQEAAAKMDSARTYQEALAMLPRFPKNRVRVVDLINTIEELRTRKTPSEIVKENLPVLTSVNDVVSQAVELRDKKKEYLLAFFVNARHQLISKEVISIGTLTASLAHPREIFSPAIGRAAAGVILVHNHPSGDPSPSDEDMRLTKRIVQAGHIMGIDLLDHLIVATQGCYSFKQAGAI